MERPLDIAFHGLESSPALEAEIREHVARMEQRCGPVVACRVSIEALHARRRTGNPFEVHVVVSLSGRDVAVSREPHHDSERRSHPDVHAALREAFHATERQLRHFKPDQAPHIDPSAKDVLP